MPTAWSTAIRWSSWPPNTWATATSGSSYKVITACLIPIGCAPARCWRFPRGCCAQRRRRWNMCKAMCVHHAHSAAPVMLPPHWAQRQQPRPCKRARRWKKAIRSSSHRTPLSPCAWPTAPWYVCKPSPMCNCASCAARAARAACNRCLTCAKAAWKPRCPRKPASAALKCAR